MKLLQQKNIWIISQNSGTPNLGGVQRHYYFSKEFQKNNWDSTIICNVHNHLLRKRLYKGINTIEEVKFLGIPTFLKFSSGVLRFLQMMEFGFRIFFLPLSKLKKPNIIILSSMSIFPVPAVLFLRWLYGAKFIFEIRDLWPLTPIHMKGVSKRNPIILLIGWYERLAFKKADKIVTTLQGSEMYINSISKNPQKLQLVQNGIPEFFLNVQPRVADKKSMQKKLVVTYGGSFGLANALEPFINLIQNQEDLVANVHFNLIGSGYLKESYSRKLASISNITLIDKLDREEFLQHLFGSDVAFISWANLTEIYKFGVSAQKYYDYMAAGIPILSAQNGINDPVRQSGCGIIVKNETNEIRKGLNQFLNMSADERENMGSLGKEYVKQFTYNRLSKKYVQLFSFFYLFFV